MGKNQAPERVAKTMPKMGDLYPRLKFEMGPRQDMEDCQDISRKLRGISGNRSVSKMDPLFQANRGGESVLSWVKIRLPRGGI